MTTGPQPRRRTLAALLALSGTVATAAGCTGPSPVPTSPDVARDPMAALDPGNWDARSAEELRALPLQGAAEELDSWGELGTDDTALDPARDTLMAFLEAAYLDPAALHGMEDGAALDHITAATPEFWADSLPTSWDEGLRHLYAFTPAEPFRTVGRPWICADWFRTERNGGPAIALGAVVAWTMIDASTRAVGVLAYQLGAILDLDAEGTATEGSLRVVVHGLDTCATDEQGGLVAPAIAEDAQHRAAQEATTELVLSSPRIPLEALMDEDSDRFAGDQGTVVVDCA